MSSNGLPPSAQLMASQRGAPNHNNNNNCNSHLDNNNIQHYRQLSLRHNTQQHHRQVSSPATSQQFYTQQRPISSYFEYEHSPANQKNGIDQQMENPLVKGPAHHHPQSQQQHASYSQQMQQQSNYGTKKETLYGIVGQQLPPTKRPMVPPISQQMVPPGGPGNIIRQQQPIFQSNQVQIYGSVYGNQPATSYAQQQQAHQQQQRASQMNSNPNNKSNNSRSGLYGSFPRGGDHPLYGHINHPNGLAPNRLT